MIGRFADPPERSAAAPLLTEEFVGVARADHPALNADLDAERFSALDHALFTLGRDGRGAVDGALAAMGLERRASLTLPYLMALPEVLRATDLVAAVPARAAACFGNGIATFDLGFLNLAPRRLHMLWSPFARKNRAHGWLRDMVTVVCADI